MRLRLRQPALLSEPALSCFPDGRVIPVIVRAAPQTFVQAAQVWAKASGGPWAPWREARELRELDALEDRLDELLAKAAGGAGGSPVKYDEKGAFRWVTVHPHGKEEKGTPVKIRESKTQPGVWHIVGGAGGKLNYLKLTKVKSIAEYKEKAGEQRKERRAAEREQKKQYEAKLQNMTPEEREAELKKRTAARDQLTTAEDQAIQAIAERVGWSPDELAFDPSGLQAANATPEQIARLEKKHRKEILSRLDKLERNVIRRVLLDHEARAAMHLGDLPFSSTDPNSIALSDLDPDKLERGLGYTLDTSQLAEEQILAHLANARIDELDTRLADLQKQAVSPDLDGEVAVLRRERDLAVLLRDHPELDTKDLHTRDRELAHELAAIDAERAEYEPDLQQLQERDQAGTITDSERDKLAELQRQDAVVTARQERVADLRETVQAVQQATGAVLEAEQMKWKEERIAAGGGDVAAHRQREDERQMKLAEYQAEAKRLKDSGAIKQPDLSVDAAVIQDPDALLDVLRQMKALKQVRRQLKAVEAANKPVDDVLRGKPLMVETREATKEQIAKAVRNELSERVTTSFLDEVESLDQDPTLADLTSEDKRLALLQYVSLGSYNALNDAALTILRKPVIPREVSDVLGAAGTAQLLARVIQADRDPEDVLAIRDAVAEHHQATHVEAAQDAMAEAQALYDQAREIQLGEIRNVSDLREMQALNARRREKLEDARAVLGRTLGELEGSAALVAAMDAPPVDQIEIAMGNISPDMVIRQARALGLQRGDYTLDSDGNNRFLTVSASGLDKLGGRMIDSKEAAELDEVDAIKRGQRDEDGWLPKGMKSWTKSAFDDPTYDAPGLSAGVNLTPIEQWSDPAHLEDWVGAQYADGRPPADIIAELNARFASVPDGSRQALGALRDKLFPAIMEAKGPDGRPVMDGDKPALRSAFGEDYAPEMARLAEQFVGRHYPGQADKVPIHAQSLTLDGDNGRKTAEALYLSVADDPRLTVAFADAAQLDEQKAAAVRSYFQTQIAAKQEGVDKAALEAKLAHLDKEIAKEEAIPPEGEQTMLFGGAAEKVGTPRLDTLRAQRRKLVDDAQDAAGLDWESYVAQHGSVQAAREAVLDHMRDQLVTRFSKKLYGATGQKLRLAQTPIRNWLRHAAGIDPAARAELRRSQKARQRLQGHIQLRNETGFAYMGGVGSVRHKVDRGQRNDEWGDQNTGSIPGFERIAETKALNRATVGGRVEAQLRALIEGQGGDGGLSRNLGRHLNEPLELFPGLSMSGKATIKGTEVDLTAQQRAIKMFKLRKRVGAFLGAGSGKTPIAIGAFTDLASDPKSGVKRGLYVVPSSVQGQFHGEIGKFVDPSKGFNWNADPSADGEARIAAHRDPKTHMMVTTYEGLRGDTMKMLRDQAPEAARGSDEGMRDWFMALSRQERAAAVKQAFGGELPYQAAFLDEGHVTLDRHGKPDSLLSAVMRAYSDSTAYYMAMTADPLKNDISEIRSQLDKIHPDGRYADEAAWQRRYGVQTTAQRHALRREVAGNFYVSSVSLPTAAHRQPVQVPLSTEQRTQYKRVMDLYDRARLEQSRGKLDIEAFKEMSPAAFAGHPESEHEAIAKRLQDGLPMSRDAALRKIINLAPAEQNAKVQTIRQRLKERPPSEKPAVIFARNPEAVEMIADTLRADGHRVATLTGSHSRKEKNARRQAFQSKKPSADVLVASDAGSTGLNLQRGKQLIHYDLPMTALTHNQRNGRIYRIGQDEDVDLLDLVTDTDLDAQAQKRLAKKYDLKSIFTGDDGAVDEDDLGAFLTHARARRRERGENQAARMEGS